MSEKSMHKNIAAFTTLIVGSRSDGDVLYPRDGRSQAAAVDAIAVRAIS
jgi:hypothetical protein